MRSYRVTRDCCRIRTQMDMRDVAMTARWSEHCRGSKITAVDWRRDVLGEGNEGRMKVTVGVFATILDAAGGVLLVHRTDCDWWCQPGGGMELGRHHWEGVIREVRRRPASRWQSSG